MADEPKVFAVHYEGKTLELRDIGLDVLDEVAAEAGMGQGAWGILVNAPGATGTGLQALIKRCIILLGGEPPEEITTRLVEEYLIQVPEDLPPPKRVRSGLDPTNGDAKTTLGSQP